MQGSQPFKAFKRNGSQIRISVIGTGYVGLVTGVVFAHLGNQVICIDTNKEKIDMLRAGKIPIYEPGLEDLVLRNAEDGRLSFTTDLGRGIRESEIIFIAVGTPPGDDGEPDLSQVTGAAHQIAQHINGYKVVVNKSTVPIGTGNLVYQIINKNKRQNVNFDVVSNPEFLREGSAMHDTLYPDRIVIGASSHKVAMRLLELYALLERPMLITDITSAEIIKYASNAFLASKISFINSIATLCEKVGGDITQVAKGMGYDKRIGEQFLQAGLGFGGSCFGKDVKALVHTMSKLGCNCNMLNSTLDINQFQPNRFVDRVEDVLGGLDGCNIAVLGLAFKPNTDDMRDAKSIDVIGRLLSGGANVSAYDPIAAENCRSIYPQITYCPDLYQACKDTSAILIVTEWDEFRHLDFERLKALVARRIIFDGRNMLDAGRVSCMGFDYYGIGRNPVILEEEAPLLHAAEAA